MHIHEELFNDFRPALIKLKDKLPILIQILFGFIEEAMEAVFWNMNELYGISAPIING
jgi:hypothetical protein